MGIYIRLAASVLILSFSLAASATTRVYQEPSIRITSQQQAARGMLTPFIPTVSNEQLLLDAEKKGWLGKLDKQVPITTKTKAAYSKPKLVTKFKDFVKTKPNLVSVAVMAALAGVGYVMDESNTKLQKKDKLIDGQPLSPSPTSDPGSACFSPASSTVGKFWQGSVNGNIVSITVNYEPNLPSGYIFANNCTSSALGYSAPAPSHRFPQAAYKVIVAENISESYRDLTAADYDAIAGHAYGFAPPVMKDMLGDVCQLSQSCYDDLQSGLPKSVTGPALLSGGTETTTSTYTKPDGTIGTREKTSETTYNIRYGDNYYDYDTVVTTTITENGQQVGQETVTDASEPIEEKPPEDESYSFTDTDFPEIEPFYEQKYQDGLQGVWDSAQQNFDNSAFMSFLQGFVPSFSGTCPAWSMSFAIGSLANYGTIPFLNLCYVFDFVKTILLVTALFTARAITFGG